MFSNNIRKLFYALHIILQEITVQSTAGMHVEKPTEYTQKVLIC